MESTITAADLDTVALDDMLARLREEALVLTVNKRLAAWLHRRHADLQAADVWETPDILPWNGWLLSLHDQLLTTGRETARLLTNHQESLIWEKIADGWNHAQGREALLRPAAAAESARAAYTLYHAWRLDKHPLGLLGGEETRSLLAWMEDFETLLASRRLLSAAALPAIGDLLELIHDEGFAGEPFEPDDAMSMAGAAAMVVMCSCSMSSRARAGSHLYIITRRRPPRSTAGS